MTAANYEGEAATAGATFEAKYRLHALGDGPARLRLPLAGVRLREARLDGAAAYPEADEAGTAYSITVKGAGPHELVVRFAANAAAVGSDREVRFGVPESVVTKVAFVVPKGAAGRPRAVNWRGEQTAAASGDKVKLVADLGRTAAVALRWPAAGPPVPPVVRVQEAYVWDIDGPTATLLAALDYRVTQGAAAGVRLAVPNGLEVARLEVRPDDAAGDAPGSWVRDWRLGPDGGERGASRLLAVEFPGPLAGKFRLHVELVPGRPPTARPRLAFPQALDAAEAEAFVAYRAAGWDAAADVGREGVTEFSARSFADDIWKPSGGPGPALGVTRRVPPGARRNARAVADPPGGGAGRGVRAGAGLRSRHRPGRPARHFDVGGRRPADRRRVRRAGARGRR